MPSGTFFGLCGAHAHAAPEHWTLGTDGSQHEGNTRPMGGSSGGTIVSGECIEGLVVRARDSHRAPTLVRFCVSAYFLPILVMEHL